MTRCEVHNHIEVIKTMFDEKILADNIKKSRIAKGLTQTELANRLNISPQSVSKWERGLSVPDIENIYYISTILGVSTDALLNNFKKSEKLMIGVDGGGTKTEFILFTHTGKLVERLVLGSCNPNIIGVNKSAEILKKGIDMLLAENSGVCGIHIGSAGFLTGDNRKEVKSILAKAFPHIKIGCHSDIMNVIASGTNKENCIAAISGTGAVVYVKNKDSLERFSGWGYLLCKKGSGYDIGRDVLYSVLQEMEGWGEKTQLTDLVKKRCGMTAMDCIEAVYANGAPYVASFAPLAFEAYKNNDKIAKNIVEENACAFAEIIKCASDKHPDNKTVILSGGIISNQKVFLNYVKERLNNKLKLIIPQTPQVIGACRMCMKMMGFDAELLGSEFEKQYIEMERK